MHRYKIEPSSGSASSPAAATPVSPAASSAPAVPSKPSFFARVMKVLNPMGFGAYHTSLSVGGFNYTFAANAGIVRSRAFKPADDENLPPDCVFMEAIVLGAVQLDNMNSINAVLNRLRVKFSPTGYHLVGRNCNHL